MRRSLNCDRPRPYRVKVLVRNNHILAAIERLGYTSVAAFCKDKSLVISTVRRYVGLAESPLCHYRWKSSALSLADALFCDPEDLWDEEQRLMDGRRKSVEAEVSRDFLVGAATPVLEMENKEATEALLRGLPWRQEKVLRGVYLEEKTHKDIGVELGVSGTRVVQIERDAIESLRKKAQTLIGQAYKKENP